MLIGRALMYGLGAAGEAGARRAFAILEEELRVALALAGYPRAADLGADAVERQLKSPSSGCHCGLVAGGSAFNRSAPSSVLGATARWWGNCGASVVDGAVWGVSCAITRQNMKHPPAVSPLPPR